jgi:hypothetical protein
MKPILVFLAVAALFVTYKIISIPIKFIMLFLGVIFE